jgi:sugar lactone lactonase YvrE
MPSTTNSTVSAFRPLVEGLDFTECPRWHDGRLWFTEHGAEGVVAASLDGEWSVMAPVPGGPAGMGWLPDVRLLVVSVRDKVILRREHDGTMVEHANLAHLTPWPLNDMVVDGQGRAFVGGFGFDYFSNAPVIPSNLYRVDPDGSVHVLPHEVTFPNGMALGSDDSVLIVAESFSNRMTAFDISSDGSLGEPRVWAQFGPPNPTSSVSEAMGAAVVVPDGICLDAEGAVWAADPQHNRVIRVEQGGRILEELPTGTSCFACELGGPDGRTLFVCVGPYVSPPFDDSPDAPGFLAPKQSGVVMTEVAVPGIGA